MFFVCSKIAFGVVLLNCLLFKALIMKNLPVRFLIVFLVAPLLFSCSKDEDDPVIRGEVTEQGQIGTRISMVVSGMWDVFGTAEVEAVEDGVSTYRIEGRVGDHRVRNAMSNRPGVEIDGENVVVDELKAKITTEGIEFISGPAYPGVIVHYDAKVGDTYSMGGTSRRREVVSVSENEDFSWRGMLIRVIEVEEPTREGDLEKTTYYANHRFGLVAIKFTDAKDGEEYWVFPSTQ